MIHRTRPGTELTLDRRSAGLTLLELLVVVAILAVLTTIAVRSTSDLGGQVRYDATQATLKAFRDGVLGPANQSTPDGSPFVTGFVADMGRPPRSYSDGLSADIPELYSGSLPSGLKAYALWAATLANTTTNQLTALPSVGVAVLPSSQLWVPAGWRGPYVTKPNSNPTFQDGWGKSLVSRLDLGTSDPSILTWPTMLLAFRTNSGQPVSAFDANYTAVKDGLREVVGWGTVSGFEGAPTATGDPYAGLFYAAIATNEYRVAVTVNVTCSSTYANFVGGTNWIMLTEYGPNPNVATDGKPLLCLATSSTYTSFSTSFTNLAGPNAPTIGNRVFRAWLRHNSDTLIPSRVVNFPIRPGVQTINIPLP